MNLIERFADPWLEFYSIHLFEMSLFISLIWLTDRLIKLNTRLRYLLWNLALLKLFVPPVISLPGAVQETVPEPVFWLPFGVEFQTDQFVSRQDLSVSEILFVAWLGLAVGLTFFIAMKNTLIRFRLRTARPIQIANSLPFSESLLSGLQFFETEMVQTPILVGLWRARIYLPVGWSSWPQNQLRSILTHEKAHLKYRDIWILFLQYFGLVLFGMNPFVWLVHRRLNQLRELRCDETAIQETGIHPVEYSKMILSFVEGQAERSVPLLIGKCFSEKNKAIRVRINHLLNFEEAKMKSKNVVYFLLPALLVLLVMPFSWQCHDSLMVTEPNPDEIALKEVGMFQKYDEAPEPIGGFGAIQENLKYPEVGRQAGIEGKMILHVLINKNGEVEDVKVLKSMEAETAGFEEAAIAAAKSVRWRPAKFEGNPVKVWVALPIVFKLGDRLSELQMGGPVPATSETALQPERSTEGETNLFRTFFDEVPKPSGGFAAIQKNLKYPEIARKAGIEGNVIVHVLISEDGDVIDTRVLKSFGHNGCDEAAVNALKSVRWEPAVQAGKPVKAWVAIPVVFKLNSGASEKALQREWPKPIGGMAAIQQNLQYPSGARKKGIEGKVLLQLGISETGEIEHVRVLRGIHDGQYGFEQAAIEAVKRVRWQPAKRDGKPIGFAFELPIEFKLK